MQYRGLEKKEIEILSANRCSAEEWDRIRVSDKFSPERCVNVTFIGDVQLGDNTGSFSDLKGRKVKSGIRNAWIENCTVGDQVYISDVRKLKSYNIGNNTVIEDVGSLSVDGETTFGNGIAIDVLNEAGGRELHIYDQLTAQIAYLIVLYRHDGRFIDKMEKLIRSYTESKRSSTGTVGAHSCIENAGSILSVTMAGWCHLQGVQYLQNGTIIGNSEAVTEVGEGVIAKNFIIHSGSKIDGGAILKNTFIGQGVQIGRQFSAENSVFFANSEGFHGEACSLFAGPYTVTHHKSTLLIAALVSFYNAGSGTNQSNHMYKLGPVHQGIIERGSKTGSFSYLLWPARVGAFTAVIGKHFTNFDTSDLPFSYITEEAGKSVLTPAMNLFTVGTRRDGTKWPNRDKRKDSTKLDLINFEPFNPYIVSRIVAGIKVLAGLSEKSQKQQEYVSYKGIHIKRLLLRTCLKYYEIAVRIFLGQQLVYQFEQKDKIPDAILESIHHCKTNASDQWVDLCGMVVRKENVFALMRDVRDDAFKDIEEIRSALNTVFDRYEQDAWNWTVQLLCSRLDKEPGQINAGDLEAVITEWKDNSIKLNNMILKDAEKEYDQASRFGYGIDGDENENNEDFTAVRGSYETNGFIRELMEENSTNTGRAERLLGLLRG